MNWLSTHKRMDTRHRPALRPVMEQIEERQLLSAAPEILPLGPGRAVLGTPPEALRARHSGTTHRHVTPGGQMEGRRTDVAGHSSSSPTGAGRHVVHVPGMDRGSAKWSGLQPPALIRPADWGSSLPPYTPAQIKHAYGFDRSSSGKPGLILYSTRLMAGGVPSAVPAPGHRNGRR
jgi:hypothetical protein